MKKSGFRNWVENIWRENRNECMVWGTAPVPLEVYFAKYKWWLKREYRYQRDK